MKFYGYNTVRIEADIGIIILNYPLFFKGKK